MPLDIASLVAPDHTALVLQEVQNGVVGSPSVLPALAEAAAAKDLVCNCARRPAPMDAARIATLGCSSA